MRTIVCGLLMLGLCDAHGEISLPSPLLKGTSTLEETLRARRSVRAFANVPLSLRVAAQLLWAGQGVSSQEGKRTAPPLLDLESHWGEDALVAYLGDPDAVTAAEPRLQVLSGEYPHRMPPVPEADENDLRVIARYLLEPRADG